MWYHGDTVKRTTFADQKWDRDATRDPNSHGPGIYWTSDYQQAKGYAYPTGYIYTAQIEGNFVSDSTPASRQFLRKLIKEVPKEDLYYALSNFDENPNKAMQMALGMCGEESFIDGALSVYSDFFRKDSRKWIAAMVALGIDGYLHEVGNVTYLIVYNADLIQVTKEEHYSQAPKEALAPSWMHEAQKEHKEGALDSDNKEKVRLALQDLGHAEDPELVASVMDDIFHQYEKQDLIDLALSAARPDMFETWVDYAVDAIREEEEYEDE